jgi:hypothetical protein
MKKIQALIDLGLIAEQDVLDYARELENIAHMEAMYEEYYSQADYEADMGHNEVLPF